MMQQEYNWEEIYRNATENLLEIFITPEVERRQESGELPKPLDLRAAQIIFYPDGRKPEIRINSEVKALAKMKLKPGVTKNLGEPVYEHELEGLKDLMLTEEDDPDCGHATILRLNDRWLLAFDFIYNKALSRKHINTAKQFIEVARFSVDKEYWSAFVDNLFSAAELLAKAVLLASWSDLNFRQNATHKAIHSRYNRFSNLGNINAEHVEAFNKLSKMRYPARYLKNQFSISDQEAQTFLDILQNMLEEAERLTRA